MNDSAKKGTSSLDNDSFNQLMLNYIRQVGQNYEADKSIQTAVKRLEKTFRNSRER